MASQAAIGGEVLLAVHVSLVDANGTPIANAPIRLVFGSTGWEERGAGTAFTTDAKGEHSFTTRASLDVQKLKAPSNFFTQLVSRAQETRHLRLAVELPYLGQSWLYVGDVNRFPDGSNLSRETMQAYGLDGKDRFTAPAPAVAAAGYELSQLFLKPEEQGVREATRWSVRLALRREPEPVRR